MNLFGRKKHAAPVQQAGPSIMESMNQLDAVDNILAKREAHTEKQIRVLRDQAKQKLSEKDKRSAIRYLTQAKQRTAELEQICKKRDNIGTIKLQLEKVNTNKQTFDAMKNANIAIQASTRQANIDDVDNVMNEITDSIDQINEIDDTIARPIGPVVDEDDLAAELAEMENEMNDAEFTQQTNTTTATLQQHIDTTQQQKHSNTINNLPNVPQRNVQQQPSTTTQQQSTTTNTGTAKLSEKEQSELEALLS